MMIKLNCTRQEATTIVATIHDHAFQPEEVEDVLFIVQRKCPNCHRPHITTVSGTPPTKDAAVYILTNAVLRITEEGLFDDDV